VIHFSSSQFARLIALLLLVSVLTGLMAPAAVAMSKDEMLTVVETEGLSSKVKDFLSDALEDALSRSVSVAHFSLTSPNRVVEGDRLLFVLAGSVDFMCAQARPILKPIAHWEERAEFLVFSTGTSGLQPLGP
jgi:hypothetical protein